MTAYPPFSKTNKRLPMDRFWTNTIKPLVETLAPARILQIGAKRGVNTQNLAECCRERGTRLDVLDPAPSPDLHKILALYPLEITFHQVKSASAMPGLQCAQLVLLDGEPNWFSVYNELQHLYLHAAKAGEAPPIVLLHCVAWPYGRRDMYINPRWEDEAEQQPYAYKGILPDRSELTDAGLYGQFANATHEGGPKNGVLTAVEDFRSSLEISTSLYVLPWFEGLAFLVPETRMTPALQTLIDGFFAPQSLMESCKLLEKERLSLQVELAAAKVALAKRSEALARAAEQLAVTRQTPKAAPFAPEAEPLPMRSSAWTRRVKSWIRAS
jgi:hypothetical protein